MVNLAIYLLRWLLQEQCGRYHTLKTNHSEQTVLKMLEITLVSAPSLVQFLQKIVGHAPCNLTLTLTAPCTTRFM